MALLRRKNGRFFFRSRNESSRRRSADCVERIKRSHRSVILESKEEHEIGLEDAVINESALQAICDRAEYAEDIFEYAAMALEYIAVFHPFTEGNKRTALAVALNVLRNGGYTLPDSRDTYEFVRRVASCEYDREQIADWLRRNAISIS